MVGPYSKDNTPALFQLLETGNFCTDYDGKPSTCDVCPLSTLVDGQGDISHDPSEAYYICRMMSGKEVWGEDPCCRITQWREMAKEELLR